MPSTSDRFFTIVSRIGAGHGAMPKPQLPSTAVVTPSDGRRRQRRIPGQLRVVVRVHVDDAGHQGEAVGIDRFARAILDAPDFRDLAFIHCDVGTQAGRAAAVVNRGAGNQEIVHAGNATGRLAESQRLV